ncbi:MAG: UDP-N-acetylmuramoyl-tripeptide--D-alanyl-D-alanine ligase [Desulfarculus sp.]|nr:MAG: UDP-N-acetylmuramoyl-tripeptide--D-alanyl-D-alanine ligase [Desulfarculus sp.]
MTAATGAALRGDPPEQAFSGVSTDSRQVQEGQLFVALSGPHFDGHDYVAAALEAGAAAAMVRRGFALPGSPRACLLAVPDTLAALGELAAAWRREHSALLAAVTGSNGKTTCKEMLAAIMAQRHQVLKNQGNFNNLIGLPLTLLKLSAAHSAVVVEMGMNAPGEIARLTQIAAPEAGVITNVGPAHLGPLGSLEAVAAAKGELFAGLSPAATAVVNLDDPYLAPWARRLSCRVLTFGLSKGAQVSASGFQPAGLGQRFSLELPEAALEVSLAAPGRHNLMNALAAAAAAYALGQGGAAIRAGLEAFRPLPGRLGLAGRPGGPALLDDTYNANPASLAAGLMVLSQVAQGRPMALILGDMLELGPGAPELHRRAGAQAVEAGCTLVLALGAQAAQVAAGADAQGRGGSKALAFSDLAELLAEARHRLTAEHVVLVKGSRAMAMERVVAALSGQPGEDA